MDHDAGKKHKNRRRKRGNASGEKFEGMENKVRSPFIVFVSGQVGVGARLHENLKALQMELPAPAFFRERQGFP
jgi:hypothetical protein